MENNQPTTFRQGMRYTLIIWAMLAIELVLALKNFMWLPLLIIAVIPVSLYTGTHLKRPDSGFWRQFPFVSAFCVSCMALIGGTIWFQVVAAKQNTESGWEGLELFIMIIAFVGLTLSLGLWALITWLIGQKQHKRVPLNNTLTILASIVGFVTAMFFIVQAVIADLT